MNEAFVTAAVTAGGSFAAGYLIGYAVRKLTGFVMAVLGLWLASIVGLASTGIVTVNMDRLSEMVAGIIGKMGSEFGDYVGGATTAAVATFGAPFIAGAIFGFAGFFKGTVIPYRRKRFVRRVNRDG